MQPGPHEAQKRKMAADQWFEQARTRPDMYKEQEDQWAILRHEVEGEDMQRQVERMRSGWDQRDTDEESLSSQSSYDEQVSAVHNVDIVVAGVGGGGMNAINRMISTRVRGVRFVAMNTDAQVLGLSGAPHRICLGQHHTKGLGAGGNAAVGRRAAQESMPEVQAALEHADLVFIAAGMGGGTGTGAAPVIASIAKQMGALTVGIVTIPFSFEGSRRRRIAEQGIAELRSEIDALITVPNDRLLNTISRERSLADAFKVADDVLRQGVQGIAEVINVPGMVNVDFADVRSVLCEAGTALMSIGQGKGRNRAQQAAEEAIAGGFLNVTIRGAKRVLFNISGGEDMTLFEVHEVAERIGAAIDDAADIIFGAVIDPSLSDTMRVTLIAAGMEELHTTRIEAIHREAGMPPASPRPMPSHPTGPYSTPAHLTGNYPAAPSAPPSSAPRMPRISPSSAPRTPPPSRQGPPVAPPAAPPPTQMPPPLRPGHPGTQGTQQGQGQPQQYPGRQQRSLNDLRGLRGMGRKPDGRDERNRR